MAEAVVAHYAMASGVKINKPATKRSRQHHQQAIQGSWHCRCSCVSITVSLLTARIAKQSTVMMTSQISTTTAMWDGGGNHFSGGCGAAIVAVERATV